MLYKILLKILWLGYRLNLTFRFWFKYIVLFKLCSICYDYYLGCYPKIFNDQGFYLKFNIFYNYICNYYIFYSYDIYFFLFLLFIYLFSVWPNFFEIRETRDHLNYKGLSFDKKENPVDLKELSLKKVELNIQKLFDNNLNLKNKSILEKSNNKLKKYITLSKKKKIN